MSAYVLEADPELSIALLSLHSRITKGQRASTRTKPGGVRDEVYNKSEIKSVYPPGTFCIYCGFAWTFIFVMSMRQKYDICLAVTALQARKLVWVMATGIFFVFAQIVICVLLPAFIMGGVKSVGICLRHQRESQKRI